MLISPLTFDTTTAPGLVSSRTSSGDETAGFTEQLLSADSALDGQSSPFQSVSAGESVPDAVDTRWPIASSVTRMPGTQASAQPAVSPSAHAIPPALANPNTPIPAVDSNPAAMNAQASRLRSSRPPASPDSKESDVKEKDTHAAASGTQAEAAGSSGAAKTAGSSPASPSVPGDTMPGIPGTAAGADSRMSALSACNPLLSGNLAAASTPALPANGTQDGNAQQLAFAVKVQPAGSRSPLSRISAGNAGSAAAAMARQTSSGNTAETDSEGADSEDSSVQATRQTTDNHGDQASAGESDATAKAAEKKTGMDGDPKPDSGTPNGLLPFAAAAGNEPPRDAAAGKSGTASPNGPAVPGETLAPDQISRPAGPMTDISVRVESAQGQNVDIRIVQRAGDLQIAVKAADDDTTQGLRHGLSELTTRLNESGYHAETWRPGHPASPAETTDSGSTSHQPPSGDSQSNSGWSQQNRGQRDNNPSNRPRWIQELESNLTGGTESTGQFHGLIS